MATLASATATIIKWTRAEYHNVVRWFGPVAGRRYHSKGGRWVWALELRAYFVTIPRATRQQSGETIFSPHWRAKLLIWLPFRAFERQTTMLILCRSTSWIWFSFLPSRWASYYALFSFTTRLVVAFDRTGSHTIGKINRFFVGHSVRELAWFLYAIRFVCIPLKIKGRWEASVPKVTFKFQLYTTGWSAYTVVVWAKIS